MSYGFQMKRLSGKEEANGTCTKILPFFAPISLVSSPVQLGLDRSVFLPTQNLYSSINSFKWTGKREEVKDNVELPFNLVCYSYVASNFKKDSQKLQKDNFRIKAKKKGGHLR